MAHLVITLPNGKAVTVTVESLDDEIIPIHLRRCECGCGEWFNPTESDKTYIDEDHQQRAKQDRRKKTERRVRA